MKQTHKHQQDPNQKEPQEQTHKDLRQKKKKKENKNTHQTKPINTHDRNHTHIKSNSISLT